MSQHNPHSPEHVRLLELLADRATEGLTAPEQAELQRLLDRDPGIDEDAIDRIVAAIDVAAGTNAAAAMPEAVRRKIEQSAAAHIAAPFNARTSLGLASGGAGPGARHRMNPFTLWGGWLAAAACLALAVFGWLRPGSTGSTGPQASIPPAEAAERLLKQPDTTRVAWKPWDAPEFATVSGDVVWNEKEQRGYVRFRGLPANDPTREQYQLWIVDERGLADASGQSARISGGVFNIAPDAKGEVVIPIDPKLKVRNAQAFAVTREKPGGTWVSDMERRVVIASKG